ncbi:hypothetical protein [Mesorhizobium sp. M0146]|uniref:hypothetical protein n=1 Tax=unclassified Mesorhizobium TaxID=325217 RepID=UPI00333B0BCD
MANPMAFATQYTRTGKPNVQNLKPYRTERQKEVARQTAKKCDDGAYRSNAPVSYHGAPKQRAAA